MTETSSAVLCVAGEESGDRLLAPIVARLKRLGIRPIGVGGPRAVSAGLECITAYEGLSGAGLVDALGTLPAAIRAYRHLSAAMPGCTGVILVDFPEVNTRLLRRAARLRRPSLYLAPPQAWAWRPWRVRSLRAATEVACLFQFEAEWFRARGVNAHWVGHPLAGRTPAPPAGDDVALLPGSRLPRVRRLLPIMLGAMARLGIGRAHLGLANDLERAAVEPMLRGSRVSIKVHQGAESALAASKFALVGAGTATLDAALADRPMVILGKVHPVTAPIARRLIGARHVGLPNLVMDREVFPELIQEACTVNSVAAALEGVMQKEWGETLSALRAALSGPAWPDAITTRLTAVLDGGRDPYVVAP